MADRYKYPNPPLTNVEKEKLLNTSREDFRSEFPEHSISFLRREKGKLRDEIKKLDPSAKIYLRNQNQALKDLKAENDEHLNKIEELQNANEVILGLDKNFKTHNIHVSKKSRTSETTAICVYSDWHIEEPVNKDAVNDLNEFNLEIGKNRVDQLAQISLKLINGMKNEFRTKNVIIGLLGDFISGTIHDDLKEGNLLLPSDAIWKAQNHIASILEFLLANTDYKFKMVCSTGNHGRMTVKQRVMTEQGNSLELYMYRNLQKIFKDNKRVEFIIKPSYHTYIDVYGYTVRFHHGHAIRYGGGVGGIYIPVNKAIAQWNKAKHADYDVFGHFHQQVDGGNFLCNGSLIGFNEYAIKIKAGFDVPKQTFFLIDSDFGKTIVSPIILK